MLMTGSFFNMAKLIVVTLHRVIKKNHCFLKPKSQKASDLEAFAPLGGVFDVAHMSHITAEGIS